MDPLASFTHATFAPLVGATFQVQLDGGVVPLVLADTVDSGRPGGSGRTQFSLMFHGPLDRVLAQGTYDVTNEQLGRFPLFLSPKAPGQEAMPYEAVFG